MASPFANIMSMLGGGSQIPSATPQSNPFGLAVNQGGAMDRILSMLGAAGIAMGGQPAIPQADVPSPVPAQVASPRIVAQPIPPAGQGAGYSQDPVAQDLPPEARAFLNATTEGEAGGKYNLRYTPQGGATFTGYGKHPGVFEPGPAGPSSAAGRYQLTQSTWNALGGGAFTPEMQDRRAWELAQRDYRTRTGKDLLGTLRTQGMTDDVMKTLTPTWQAFGNAGARKRSADAYTSSLERFGKGQATPVAWGPANLASDRPTQPAKASTSDQGTLTGLFRAAQQGGMFSRILPMLGKDAQARAQAMFAGEGGGNGSALDLNANSVSGPLGIAAALGDRFSTDGMRRSTNVEDLRDIPFVDDQGVPLPIEIAPDAYDADAARRDAEEIMHPQSNIFTQSLDQLIADGLAKGRPPETWEEAVEELKRKMEARRKREPMPGPPSM